MTEHKRRIAADEIEADAEIAPRQKREPMCHLSNRLRDTTRPSGPQVGRSVDGMLWQKVSSKYRQLRSPKLEEQTRGKSRCWLTLEQRFKEDDGSWNQSGRSWAESMHPHDLEWMRAADKMYEEQAGDRAAKGCLPMKLDTRNDAARHMWDIAIPEYETWFHCTRIDKHTLDAYKKKAAFLMKDKKLPDKSKNGKMSRPGF